MARFMKIADSNNPGFDHHINLDAIQSIWLDERTVVIRFIGSKSESIFTMESQKEAIDFYNKIVTHSDT